MVAPSFLSCSFFGRFFLWRWERGFLRRKKNNKTSTPASSQTPKETKRKKRKEKNNAGGCCREDVPLKKVCAGEPMRVVIQEHQAGREMSRCLPGLGSYARDANQIRLLKI